MGSQVGGHAVVLGAGMAGLLAASVLMERYERVTLVERDAAPGNTYRSGVPQGRHTHALLARGQQVLEDLLPGLTATLTRDGVPAGDVLAGCRWHLGGHRFRRTSVGLTAVCPSRPLLEDRVRARVVSSPAVTFLDCCHVVDLSAANGRVTGITVNRDGHTDTLVADLVVDATGRGSRLPAWLTALGYPRPQEQRVPVGLAYATRTYALSPAALNGDHAIVVGGTGDHPRGGILQLIEGDRCIVTLAGRLGDDPPVDPDRFLEYAGSLPIRDMHEALSGAPPLDDGAVFRFPASRWRRYERLLRFPGGLIVLGDAVASFNPVYAQGMTVAALQAALLRDHLDRGREPDPVRFLAESARVVERPWRIAAGADLALAGARRTPADRIMQRYVARLHAGAACDAGLAAAFLRVAGLVDGPERLFHPRIVAGTLWHGHHRVGSPGCG